MSHPLLPVIIMLVLKIVSFIGATLNTLGFLTFFFFDGLAGYRWQFIVGGLVLIALGEGLSYLYGKHLLKSTEDDGNS